MRKFQENVTTPPFVTRLDSVASNSRSCDKRYGWEKGPKGKCVRRKRREQGAGRSLLIGSGIGAAISVATVGFVAKKAIDSRNEYRKGFATSFSVAKANSDKIKTARYSPGTKSAVFCVGGFGTDDALSESKKISSFVSKESPQKTAAIPFEYKDFNVSQMLEQEDLDNLGKGGESSKESLSKILKGAGEAGRLFTRTLLEKKYNPAARRLAAEILASMRDNPDIEHSLIGHSGGGYVVQEAAEILNAGGIKIKTTAIGTPDVGVFTNTGDVETLVSNKDQVLNATTRRGVNSKSFDSVPGHGLNEYLADGSVREHLKKRLALDKRKRSDSLTKPKCDPKYGWEKGPKGKCVRIKKTASANGASIGSAAAAAAGIVAGAGGISAGAYLAARASYRANTGKHANAALELSKKIDPKSLPDFKGKKQVLLVMPGFSGQLGPTQRKSVEKMFGEQFASFAGKETGTFMLPNDHYNIGKDIPDYVPEGWNPKDLSTYKPVPGQEKKLLKNLASTLTDPVLRQGYNRQAVEASAYILAMEDKFRQQNPGVEPKVKATGYSAGGIILADSNMHLQKLGKNVDMLFFGSPYLGISDQTDNITRIFSKNDALLGRLPSGKAMLFNDVTNHTGYQDNPEVKKVVEQWMSAKPEAKRRSDSARGRAKCDPRYGWKRGPGGKCIRSEPESSSGKADVNPETGKPYTIRELRVVARGKGIVGYGSMTVEQMQTAIKIVDQNPDEAQKRRLIKTVSNQRGASAKAVTAGFGKLSLKTQGEKQTVKSIKDAAQEWKRLEALMSFAGSAPAKWGGAAAGAFLLGVGIRQWEAAKESYRKGLPESAKTAQERVPFINVRPIALGGGKGKTLPSLTTRKNAPSNNITFAVGSALKTKDGAPESGQDIINSLASISRGGDATEGDKWLAGQTMIPFDMKETGIPPYKGKSQIGRAAHVAINGIGNAVRNKMRGRNQDAIDLAANLFAYAREYPNKRINIVAHSTGGMATKEALEIISKMEVKADKRHKAMTGKDVVKRFNVVLLGTPHFGYTENVSPNMRSITSAQDPLSILPSQSEGARNQWISSVKGHESKQYLSDPYVRESMREAFGYYRADSDDLDETIRLDGGKCGPGWEGTEGNCRRAKKREVSEAVKRARAGKGRIYRYANPVGKDLERAYIKIENAKRVSKIKKARLAGEKVSIFEPALSKADLTFKKVGIAFGQGHVSKTLKSADEAVVTGRERAENFIKSLKRIKK